MSKKLKCPECGWSISVEEPVGGSWVCEGDNWPGVDRGHHPQKEMTETSLSKLL